MIVGASACIHLPASPQVLLVVRVRGITRVAPKTKKILQLLRLRQLNNAVFMKALFPSILALIISLLSPCSLLRPIPFTHSFYSLLTPLPF
jgi:ribosomal protein L30/L7E